jgi:hypothetical protein
VDKVLVPSHLGVCFHCCLLSLSAPSHVRVALYQLIDLHNLVDAASNAPQSLKGCSLHLAMSWASQQLTLPCIQTYLQARRTLGCAYVPVSVVGVGSESCLIYRQTCLYALLLAAAGIGLWDAMPVVMPVWLSKAMCSSRCLTLGQQGRVPHSEPCLGAQEQRTAMRTQSFLPSQSLVSAGVSRRLGGHGNATTSRVTS